MVIHGLRVSWCIILLVLVIQARLAQGEVETQIAWTVIGPDERVIVRALLTADNCPTITIGKTQLPMRNRSAPVLPAFPNRVCEATLKQGVSDAHLFDARVPGWAGRPDRIVVIGDTGCRVKKNLAQACNDPEAWPFWAIARSAAAWQPDLVIHVGDYFYRDTQCPASNPSCLDSPWGDNWQVAWQDFFRPAGPLLRAAPWVMVRGNHESCNRTGKSWFRFLDPRAFVQACTDQTEGYTVSLGRENLYVLDTTMADDIFPVASTVEHFAKQLKSFAGKKDESAWLLSHKPIWAFGSAGGGRGRPMLFRTNPTLQAAAKLYFPATIETVLSGHLHQIQFLRFADAGPAQITVGNGGALLNPRLQTDLRGLDIAGRTVEASRTDSTFGFLTLERREEKWLVTARNVGGAPRHSFLTGANLVAELKN